MKRYSKRVREEAALICAIAASSNATLMYGPIRRDIGATKKAWRIACRAYYEVGWQPEDRWADNTCVRDAEAEALIRSGWTPD